MFQSRPLFKNFFSGISTSLVLLSCSNQQSSAVFSILSSSQTHINFTNKLEKKPLLNILYFLYYYDGGGVAIGDINNDGLSDIYFTANSYGNNKLYLNKGNFAFEDITSKAKVASTSEWCSGVSMADINADGWLDIYVSAISEKSGLIGHNELFINNHDGTFTERAESYGLNFSCYSNQAAFFDFDRDGDLDCYLLNQSDRPFLTLVDTSNRRKFDRHSGDKLLRNDLNTTAKKFTDVSAAAGIYQSNLGYGLGLAVADINNDGWNDIYVGNDFHENDYYYVNNGNGTFTESGALHFNHYSRFSMGNDVADYNNDGQLDIVTADMLPDNEKILKTYGSDENLDIYNFKIIKNGFQHQYSKNSLQYNNGNGSSFSETSLLSGVAATDWSWSPLLADFDNDGNKDLAITSGIVKRTADLDYVRFVSDLQVKKGSAKTDEYDEMAIEKMPDGSSHPFLFKGSGGLSFTDVSKEWGTGNMHGYYNGSAYGDLDNDGNLDMVINCLNAPAVILKNKAPKKNYISLSFRSNADNKFGTGCKAYIFQKGKMQYQQLMPVRGFQSCSDPRLHFGLDTISTVDSILIVWPGQQFQVLKNVAANRQLTINEKDAAGIFEYTAWFPQPVSFLKEASGAAINWQHKENNFDDFNNQYLIPHAQSTRGPKIAVADVNGDGLEDMYACGAKGQPGTLLIQQKNGSFIQSDINIFNNDVACEDVDALFFDANGDGKPDLYVVSGGNEVKPNNDTAYLDRLYLNNGKGHFAKAGNMLPPLFYNKSCVAAADIDHDGDADLFIGNLANPAAYGIPQTSYLLINNGKGSFTVAANNDAFFKNIGIVTTASFADINNDGWQDLAVAGEFMPIHIFVNSNGTLEKNVLAQSTGLWQTVFMDDVNGDGNMDILTGNWGWNNKFWSGKNGPLKMYVADFDKNGKTEQLLSYTLDGIEYPFLPKDEVERPLPLLKKHYLLYAEYSGVPMKDVFYGWVDTIKPFMAERLGSAICYGDGKGNFTINDLPAQLQLAPIFSFQKIEEKAVNGNTYIAGGNFFDVIPYEGRYDAQPLALFSISNNKKVTPVTQSNLAAVKGQVRDIKWIKSSNKNKILAVARNNAPMILFKKNISH